MSGNYLVEQVVKEVIDSFLKNSKGVCNSDICRKKMFDTVTERLEERYKLTEADLSYARIQGIDIQIKADAIQELNKVIKDVSGNLHDI